MIYIASTRFNQNTLQENNTYKRTHNIPGVIYGVSIKIFEKYPVNSILFVIEMNNDENSIHGIGLIRNSLITDKPYPIYEDTNYNRFIYKGDWWISGEMIQRYDPQLLPILENLLFKGKSHLKRQSGISILREKLYKRWNCQESIIKKSIINIFLLEYKKSL